MNRGVDHQAVFFDDADRLEFGERLEQLHEELDVVTLAYCLMGNHFHLVLRAPMGVLSEGMRQLTGRYTQRTNRRVGRDGPLFRGRFHSLPVETDRYLLWVVRYVHRNPLALPGITSPRDYRWSSYRTYLGLRPAPPFVDLAPVLSLVGGRSDRLAAITEDLVTGPHPPARAEPVSATDLRTLVASAIAVDDVRHSTDEAHRQQLTRTIFVLLAARAADPGVRRSAAVELGTRSTVAARSALRRADQRANQDPAVNRIVDWVEVEAREWGAIPADRAPECA